MVGCLTLRKECKRINMTECIVKGQLQFYPYEMVEDKEHIMIITWNMKQELIWQIALMLEYSGVMVGYGFGGNKEIARKKSLQLLEIRTNLS